ncbi:MAG: hypothetical protein IPK82_01070 [Polyangiaceae bacterium]|nr:hypothetical protein [Polyangiaceae bacterium]
MMLQVHKKIVLGQAVGGAVFNFFLNAATAYFTFPPIPSLPMFAKGNCVAGDTVGTSFFLPLITCLILTPVTKKIVKSQNIDLVKWSDLPAYARFGPSGAGARGALIGLICAFTIAPLTLGILSAAGFTEMTRFQVTLYKALYTVFLGILVTPVFAVRAFAGPQPTQPK